MPKLRALTLGFFLLGFELLVFRGLDIIYYKTFWLLMPLIMFGSALGSACGYFIKRKPAPDWWLLLALAGAAFFFYWCQIFIGTNYLLAGVIILALVTTFAWGLSNVQTYAAADVLAVSALGCLGGIVGSAAPLLLNVMSYPWVIWTFLALALALGALSAWGTRAVWGFAVGLAALGFVRFGYLDPDPSAPALAYYGNSFAQIKVQNFERLGRSAGSAEDFKVAADSATPRVLSLFRNHAEASLVFDVLDLNLFPELKLEPSYALLDLGRKDDVAIVGAGGGQEIVQAQGLGYQNITAIEINPNMIRASREHSRNPELGYGGKNVTIVNQDARFYFRHLAPEKKFDTITLSLIRNYGSVGLLTYAENYIFTEEAFAEYMHHLKPSGLLIVKNSRGENFNSSISNAMHAAAKGHGKVMRLAVTTDNHYIIRGQDWIVEVYAAAGFSPGQRAALMKLDDSRAHPRLLKNSEPAATDNKPYVNWSKKTIDQRPTLADFFTPLICLIPVLLLSLLLFSGKGLSPQNTQTFGYAILSGLAYFGLQSIYLEKVTLLTGLPTASLLAVLNTFLAGGVAGSWLARRHDLFSKLPGLLKILAVSGLAAYVGLKWLDNLPLNAGWLLMCAAGALMPVTLLAGLCFAVFLKRTGEKSPAAIPLILALNGAGSLMAGIESKGLAIAFGFDFAFGISLVLYLAMIGLVRPELKGTSA